MKCDCEDWENSEPQIIDAQMLAWNHGILYTGTPFVYCPWCGKKLQDDKNEM